MKKIYQNPTTTIVEVEVHGALLQNLSTSEKEIKAANAGLTKESNSDWGDVWGSDDDDE